MQLFSEEKNGIPSNKLYLYMGMFIKKRNKIMTETYKQKVYNITIIDIAGGGVFK